MARRETILDLLDRLAPEVREAFIQAIANVRSDTQIAALEAAYERGDIEGMLRVLALEQGYFAPLDRAIRDTYESGGDWALDEVLKQAKRQGAKVTARFDGANPRSVDYLREQSSRLIVEITDSVRQSVRDTASQAMQEGRSPRSVALDLVGRQSRATGRREGGIIGLTDRQAGWARSAEAELLSGDPSQMRAYLDRKARDKRFDRTVLRAIQEERPVGAGDVRNMVARYRDRLLRYRGETIARTEVLGSLHAAQDEGLKQLVDQGKVREQDVERVWDASLDSDTRLSHAALDGNSQGPDGVFTTINGARLRFPGDTSLGAPAEEIINCRCRLQPKVDFIAGLRDRLTPEDLAEAQGALAG